MCTTAGVSSGQICTNHTATVADDDGGFIRMSAQTYYQHPVTLSGAPLATSTPTTAPTNTPTTAPTSTPTSRPTNTPVPTATPTQVPAAPSFSSTASVNSVSVPRGGSEVITASIKSATATSALVDVEVYSAGGTKVFQQFWDGQAFAAGQTRTLTATWAVPSSLATGAYTVKIGVFSNGWGTLYNWNNTAATLTVT
jgi:hypothetical protein